MLGLDQADELNEPDGSALSYEQQGRHYHVDGVVEGRKGAPSTIFLGSQQIVLWTCHKCISPTAPRIT